MLENNEQEDHQSDEESSEQKPNPNLQPPTFDRVTEGYDPSKIKKG